MSPEKIFVVFHPEEISLLSSERGYVWENLLSTVSRAGANSPEEMGFILFISRLINCASCDTDSYRALLGCGTCAKHALKRYHGTDEDLLALYHQSRQEISSFLLL